MKFTGETILAKNFTQSSPNSTFYIWIYFPLLYFNFKC